MVMMDAKEIAKDPWAQKAAALIHDGRETIARSVSTQMRQFNPRFGDVDGDAQVQRVTLILQALEALLKGKSVSFLLGAAEDVMALGAMAGFGPPEFVKATHCYLPVLRRYFIRTDGLENGLAIFERVESVALVLIDRLIDIAFETETMATLPDVARASTSGGPKTPAPWTAEDNFILDFSNED